MQEVSTVNPKGAARGKTFYNDVALRLGQKLYGLKYFHYGYFKDMDVTVENLPRAQERYVQELLSHIPQGVREIYDVGCGPGGIAKALVQAGYTVTCVDPDPYLTQHTYQVTGEKIRPVNGFYEKITDFAPNSTDMVMMPESCQYIDVEKGWIQNAKVVRPGGHVLICDFFKIRPLDQPYLSKSGHVLTDFIAAAEKHGFELVKKVDITPETSPTMDLYQDMILNKIFPILESGAVVFQRRFPWGFKLVSYFVKNKALFLKKKYESQDSKTFSTYKGYYTLLFKKTPTLLN